MCVSAEVVNRDDSPVQILGGGDLGARHDHVAWCRVDQANHGQIPSRPQGADDRIDTQKAYVGLAGLENLRDLRVTFEVFLGLDRHAVSLEEAFLLRDDRRRGSSGGRRVGDAPRILASRFSTAGIVTATRL